MAAAPVGQARPGQIPHSGSVGHFGKHEDFDHIFSEDELVTFLSAIENKAHGEEQVDFDMFSSETAPTNLALQFLPHSQMHLRPMGLPEGGASSASSALDVALTGTALAAQHTAPAMNAEVHAIMNGLTLPDAGVLPTSPQQRPPSAPTARAPLLPAHAANNPLMPFCNSQSVPPALAPAFPGLSPGLNPLAGQFSRPPPLARGSFDGKPNVSHSTVEKARRDRINSLIDELRELVPPQKGSAGKPESNTESRRPKHVVLADTISLLKSLQLHGGNVRNLPSMLLSAPGSLEGRPCSDSAVAPAPPVTVKCEPSNSDRSHSKGSISSHDDAELRDDAEPAAAPKLPHIPMQPTQLAGVSVEPGPQGTGTMFIQIKCRDRQGLLHDIVDAMRDISLEIKTAAVTTGGDGQVRDVFEVLVPDPGLGPDDVQNMVHESLFDRRVRPSGEQEHGKRVRPS